MPPMSSLERGVLWIVLLTTAAFVAFFYGLRARDGSVGAVLRQRVLGGALLGGASVLAALLAHPAAPLGLALPAPRFVPVAAALYVVAALPTVFAARRPAFLAQYPEMRTAAWSPRLRALNAASWVVYLLGYELLFRGVLVLGLAPRIGPWSAAALSTGLYTLAHLHKGAAETAGCLPFGVAMASLALASGSMLGPWLVHVAVALTAEGLALRLGRRG